MILRLQSTNRGIAELEGYVKQLLDYHDLSPELYPNILISLTEAVNNAIKHGNHNDTNKVVCVKSTCQEQRLCCIVSDEGAGFDYSNLPDPTKPENIDKDGGRGVFLMRQLSDNVKFLKNGSTVEIEFYL
jgi:serine/threonine-protein kinase RsbW